MTGNNTPTNTRPKPPSVLSGLILLGFKVILISLTAWLILLLWFLGKFLWINPLSTLTAGQHIVELNNAFIGHKMSWIKSLSDIVNLFPYDSIKLILLITGILISRIMIFLLAMPLFGLFLLILATDGLVQREIRKFQGARESTLIFHRAKLCLSFSFFVPLFIFLSIPVYISPIGFLITQSLMLSLSAWFAMKYFKKYV